MTTPTSSLRIVAGGHPTITAGDRLLMVEGRAGIGFNAPTIIGCRAPLPYLGAGEVLHD